MSRRRKILYVFLTGLVLIQFIRPAKNQSTELSPNDISMHYPVSSEVQKTLNTACMDCHSNNTIYPWYTNIQPIGWWMQDHVNEGKKHLNFSEFASYKPIKANHKLEEVIESQEEGWMPIDSYLWAHTDANLSASQKQAIIDWAKITQQQIQGANPGVDFSKKD